MRQQALNRLPPVPVIGSGCQKAGTDDDVVRLGCLNQPGDIFRRVSPVSVHGNQKTVSVLIRIPDSRFMGAADTLPGCPMNDMNGCLLAGKIFQHCASSVR